MGAAAKIGEQNQATKRHAAKSIFLEQNMIITKVVIFDRKTDHFSPFYLVV
jgi:hypothetical protein